MFAVLFLSLLAQGTPSAAQEGRVADRMLTKRAAWQLGSKLSLAALGHGQGASRRAVYSLLDEAKAEAQSIGADVLPLPPSTGNSTKDSAAALAYLLNEAGPPIKTKIATKHGADHAALFELALKSTILLLIYAPHQKEGTTIAEVIGRLGPRAAVPERLWKPVTDKIYAGASFADVKAAVIQVHEHVRQYLSR